MDALSQTRLPAKVFGPRVVLAWPSFSIDVSVTVRDYSCNQSRQPSCDWQRAKPQMHTRQGTLPGISLFTHQRVCKLPESDPSLSRAQKLTLVRAAPRQAEFESTAARPLPSKLKVLSLVAECVEINVSPPALSPSRGSLEKFLVERARRISLNFICDSASDSAADSIQAAPRLSPRCAARQWTYCFDFQPAGRLSTIRRAGRKISHGEDLTISKSAHISSNSLVSYSLTFTYIV